MKKIEKNGVAFYADPDRGTITGLKFSSDQDQMNWLISPELLLRYQYSEDTEKLLGKSYLEIDGKEISTEHVKPVANMEEDSVEFSYQLEGIQIRHRFSLEEGRMKWRACITNETNKRVTITKACHWMPVQYVMHETREENLTSSCSFVPSVSGERSYIWCKKRSGEGPDLLILNTGGKMKSIGSLCRYKNLFFEKSAPSLSGLVLFHTVNAYPAPQDPLIDWQYREMYQPILLEKGESFCDSYEFLAIPAEMEAQKALYQENFPVFHFSPVSYCGDVTKIALLSAIKPVEFKVEAAGDQNIVVLLEGNQFAEEGADRYEFSIQESQLPGERKVTVLFEDGTTAFLVFTVYKSMKDMVLAFCDQIYHRCFINDPSDPDYCGYQSISRQGESCAKGSLLLLKNLLMEPSADEIHQAEKNAVLYLKKRWLDDDFHAIKQYPGGFARIIDMDYLTMEFYLLSQFDDALLKLHKSDEYLIWAYQTSVYRLTETPDKLARENFEVGLSSMISWIQAKMATELEKRGHLDEAKILSKAWNDHIKIQKTKVAGMEYVETEHYFDNAGISTYLETMMHSSEWKLAMPAADLLLANVADSTDYRNYAPDRWWEAVAPMYHNLWATFSAKALLTAFEVSGQQRYLEPAYRAMIPMFYNYDWRAVSAPNRFSKGEGVSAYCLTNPNLNTQKASRNRFGQSIFEDEFFSQIDISGDDWDLGMDMVVYLYTFGQKTYVVEKNEQYEAVNGKLKTMEDGILVLSEAAFPTEYCLLPWKIVIAREDRGILIHSVLIQDGNCIKIEVEGTVTLENPVRVTKNGELQDNYKLVIKPAKETC